MKPGPMCSICKHRERAAIDLALARGVAPSALARRYGFKATDAFFKHRRNHMPAQLKANLIAGPDLSIDLDALRRTESQSLLANLVALRQRLFAQLDRAEEIDNGYLFVNVSSQLHRNMEMVARMLGELNVGTSVTNILVLPTYVQMRVELVRALAPYPQAREAVAQVLHRLEAKAAIDIAAEDRTLAGAKGVAPPPSVAREPDFETHFTGTSDAPIASDGVRDGQ